MCVRQLSVAWRGGDEMEDELKLYPGIIRFLTT